MHVPRPWRFFLCIYIFLDVGFESVVTLGLFPSFSNIFSAINFIYWFESIWAAVWKWIYVFGRVKRGRAFCTSGDCASQISSVHHSWKVGPDRFHGNSILVDQSYISLGLTFHWEILWLEKRVAWHSPNTTTIMYEYLFNSLGHWQRASKNWMISPQTPKNKNRYT